MQVSLFGSTLPMLAYTTADDVKRILRSRPQRRIRTSESIRAVQVTGSVTLSGIEISNAHASQDQVTVEFSGPTIFAAKTIDTDTRTSNLIGSGTTSTLFTADDGSFRIQPMAWGGMIQSGNKIQFNFDSHISMVDLHRFIRDAEAKLDTFFMKVLGIDPKALTPGNRLFKSLPDTLDAIKSVAEWCAAFLVYNTVFAAGLTQVQTFRNRIPTEVDVWKENATETIGNLIDAFAQLVASEAPRILADKIFFPFKGVPETGGIEGVVEGLSRLSEITDAKDLKGEFENIVFAAA